MTQITYIRTVHSIVNIYSHKIKYDEFFFV